MWEEVYVNIITIRLLPSAQTLGIECHFQSDTATIIPLFPNRADQHHGPYLEIR